MDFIKLRGMYISELYINVKNIVGFYRIEEYDEYFTKIYTSGSDIPFLVYNSIEEILDKIKEVTILTINSDDEERKLNGLY